MGHMQSDFFIFLQTWWSRSMTVTNLYWLFSLLFPCWKSNYRGLAASFTIWNHFAPEIVQLLDNSLALQCFTLSINSRPSSKLPPCFFLKRHNKQSPACVHDFQGRVAFGVPREKLGLLPSWTYPLRLLCAITHFSFCTTKVLFRFGGCIGMIDISITKQSKARLRIE